MFLWLIIIFIVLFIYYIIANRVHLDWKSFFKAGFSKKDENFGLYCYTGKQGKRENLFSGEILYR